MLNFFAIVLIILTAILLLVFKKRSFRKLINRDKLHSVQLKKNRKNNKFLSNKKSSFYKHEVKKNSLFYKNSQRNEMLSLFRGNTEDKLKALKIAEELADKSTLSILRKGLRDMSPEVVKISALLIRKFKLNSILIGTSY